LETHLGISAPPTHWHIFSFHTLPHPYRERVSCIRCGRVRSVNEYLLCGPCSLRVKMGQQWMSAMWCCYQECMAE